MDGNQAQRTVLPITKRYTKKKIIKNAMYAEPIASSHVAVVQWEYETLNENE